MNANMLLNKILERGLDINEALWICEELCEVDRITIRDAVRIKEILGLSNIEAVEIFLS